MPGWLCEIALYGLFLLAIYAIGLNQAYKKAKNQLEEVIKINHQIYKQLIDTTQENEELKYGKSETRERMKSANDFLSADDPMDAILRQVGRLGR